jgi:bacteriocin-like protein
MLAKDAQVGDLIRIPRYGFATVAKFLALEFIGAIVLEGEDAGMWVYLRGLDLQRTQLVKEANELSDKQLENVIGGMSPQRFETWKMEMHNDYSS